MALRLVRLPVVVPSQDGRGVDYGATLVDLLAVLTGTGERTITAVYTDRPAEFSTTDLQNLGETGVIGEFQTGGFATDSGRNIMRAAEQLDGIVVGPGQTFSLNAATNPRNAAAGYFEATVTGDIIDVKFRNNSPMGVLIRTDWTPSSVTVRLLGVKRYEVTSSPGPRTNPTSPKTVRIPAGEPCSASTGSPGFTITDTRTLREISTGISRTETRTVRYDPAPKVICGG